MSDGTRCHYCEGDCAEAPLCMPRRGWVFTPGGDLHLEQVRICGHCRLQVLCIALARPTPEDGWRLLDEWKAICDRAAAARREKQREAV